MNLETYLTDKEKGMVASIADGDSDLLDCPDLYERLYEYYLPDMPYGTAKARDGDPLEWIFERLQMDTAFLDKQ